jgi:hypothetical protein
MQEVQNMNYYWHDAKQTKPEPGVEVLVAYFIIDRNDEGSSYCLDNRVCYFPANAKAMIKPLAKTTSDFIRKTDTDYQIISEEGWYMLDTVNETGFLRYRKVKEPMFWTNLLMPDNKTLDNFVWRRMFN